MEEFVSLSIRNGEVTYIRCEVINPWVSYTTLMQNLETNNFIVRDSFDTAMILLCLNSRKQWPKKLTVYDGFETACKIWTAHPTSFTTLLISNMSRMLGELGEFLEKIDRTSLQDLSMNRCKIDSVNGGQLLQNLLQTTPLLKHLTLEGNPLGAAGLSCALAIRPTVNLETVDLTSCNLWGAEGGMAVRLLLQYFTHTLKILILAENDLLNDGLLEITEGGLDPVILEELDMSRCGFEGVEGGKALGDLLTSCRSLRVLKLSKNYGFGADGLSIPQFSLLENLIKVDVSGCGLSQKEESEILNRLNGLL
eukprot:Platyproteum_vivax@DN1269_c0_g1_i1.p1